MKQVQVDSTAHIAWTKTEEGLVEDTELLEITEEEETLILQLRALKGDKGKLAASLLQIGHSEKSEMATFMKGCDEYLLAFTEGVPLEIVTANIEREQFIDKLTDLWDRSTWNERTIKEMIVLLYIVSKYQ